MLRAIACGLLAGFVAVPCFLHPEFPASERGFGRKSLNENPNPIATDISDPTQNGVLTRFAPKLNFSPQLEAETVCPRPLNLKAQP